MRKFRNLTQFALAGAVALSTLTFAPDAQARKVRLRLTTLAPKDSSFDKALDQMGREWKKATSGDVDLMVFSGGVQGGESAMIDRMRINQTQAALLSGVGLSEMVPSVAVFQQVPLLYRSLDELDYVMEKYGPKLAAEMEEKGFVILSWIDTGWVGIFSKFLIEKPEDMAKGKLFTWAGDNEQTELLKRMGFRPVPIDSTEIMPSLQTGLIDIVSLPPFYVLASQMYNVTPYLLDFNYAPLIGGIVVTKRVWDRLPKDQQQAMRKIAQNAGRTMRKAGRQENVSSVQIMERDWGVKVRKLDDGLRQKWRASAEEAYGYIRGNTVPENVWDDVNSLLEEYRASKGEGAEASSAAK